MASERRKLMMGMKLPGGAKVQCVRAEIPKPGPLLLHKNLTLHGSWVTSMANMERLMEFLARKRIHPNDIITHRFALRDTDKAYEVFAGGKTGKVCINMEME